DEQYAAFIREITENMEKYLDTLEHNYQIYFEHPDNIYLIFTNYNNGVEEALDSVLQMTRVYLRNKSQKEVWFDPQVCFIRYPEDITDEEEIINLCHRFTMFGGRNQKIFRASEIVSSRDFVIQNNIDTILDRAINNDELQMYYQPIFSTRENVFHSAEALARVIDKEYGIISPAIFIPAAEKSGAIIPLGERIIDQVFRFISEHDLQRLNVSYIEINLSVAQLLQPDLPDVISRLQKKYDISPEMVNFEITESLLDSMSYVMDGNIKKLSEMGYCFSLDDYGVGYSNIQRLRKLPLSMIKIDKSMVDDIFTEDGGVIIKNTVRMMQGINKKLIMEGAETRETVELLSSLSCEYIQGFYFSKPLPEPEFIRFLKENNDASKPKLYS
ncbi:MAG: EAL domain-containing protein, partial [Erysipelotrichaceae bacterium]|nr:EAL domain-containing protein [Erysipelotrichaceae bacterium]